MGGSSFKRLFQYPTSETCGEAWGISAHPEGSSIIRNGKYKGMDLRTLYMEHRELFGDYPDDTFPILVKLIDAKQNLSVQVHPNDNYAKKYFSRGKEECWTILSHNEDASIYIGHHAKTKQEWITALKENKVESLLASYPIHKRDFFYIKTGTIHAIKAGTTLLEVQQSSNITFRLYDYNREQDGKKRELHIKEAMDVMNIPDHTLQRTPLDTYFKYDIVTVSKVMEYTSDIYGDYIFVLEGQGRINDIPIAAGDFLMVTATDYYKISGNVSVQRTRLVNTHTF